MCSSDETCQPASLADTYAATVALSTRIIGSAATAGASCIAAGVSPAAVGEPAAVDGQADSGDVGRGAGGEEDHGVGDLDWAGEPAERRAALEIHGREAAVVHGLLYQAGRHVGGIH